MNLPPISIIEVASLTISKAKSKQVLKVAKITCTEVLVNIGVGASRHFSECDCILSLFDISILLEVCSKVLDCHVLTPVCIHSYAGVALEFWTHCHVYVL